MIKERILALAYTPANRKQITDWPPFGVDKLAEIVDKHNKMQKERWKGSSPEDIKNFMPVFDVVRHDLNTIGELVREDYNSIVILLADRDIDIFQEKPNELEWIKTGLSRSTRGIFYLAQAGQKQEPKRLVDFFKARVRPYPGKPPHALNSQSEFEYLLDVLHLPPDPLPHPGENVLDDLFPPPPRETGGAGGGGGGGGLRAAQKRKEYLSAHAKVRDEVRDAAIEQGLSIEEAQALARLATQEELALREVARQVRGKLSADHVILDALRTPAPRLAVNPYQTPSFDMVELVEFRPARAIGDLSAPKRRIMSQLGLTQKNYSAVTMNTPEAQSLVKRLGDSVRVNVVSAHLPTFKTEL
jgi:hypothetical protein